MGVRSQPSTIDPEVGPRLVSVGRAASLLGISRSHAYRLVAAGELRSVQLGRRVLVPMSAIELLSA